MLSCASYNPSRYQIDNFSFLISAQPKHQNVVYEISIENMLLWKSYTVTGRDSNNAWRFYIINWHTIIINFYCFSSKVHFPQQLPHLTPPQHMSPSLSFSLCTNMDMWNMEQNICNKCEYIWFAPSMLMYRFITTWGRRNKIKWKILRFETCQFSNEN